MNGDFVIRDYRREDFIFLDELWSLTGMGGIERGDNQEVIQRTIDSGGKLFILTFKTDRIIGSSWLSHDSRRMYIHHFTIHPEFQGKGLSKLLMDTSMEYCRKIGLQVKLEVHQDNYRAINLYKKYGYSDLEGYKVLIRRDLENKKP